MRVEAEQIEQQPRPPRRRWWMMALGASLVIFVFAVVSRTPAIVLEDGTEVRYLGFVRGKPLPHTEFERAVYAYPGDLFDPPGTLERLERVFRRRTAEPTEYVHAPHLLMVRVATPDSSRFEGRVSLEDDFGAFQTLGSRWPPIF